MSWGLAIDYGTSFTAGAVHHEGIVELVEVEDSPRFPSAVLVGEDGLLLTGRAALNQARRFPESYERAPKRLAGQPAALLGGHATEVADMVGAVLRRVGEAARTRQGSSAPDWVRLTHPAGWGPERQDVLRDAARRAGLGEVELLTEPEAAAWFFVEDRRGEEPVVETGGCVAVYDLGGGTFDTAVLRRSDAGFSLAGPPGGLDWFGGEDFDQRLYDWVLGRVYEVDEATWRWHKQPAGTQARRAKLQLREDVRQAKEALSTTAVVSVPVATEGDQAIDVAVGREEFERLIRDDLERTVAVLDKTVRDAGVAPEEITAVYLTGGSSRVPLAGAFVSRFHPLIFTRPDPKTLVARGAIAARFPVVPTTPAPAAVDPTPAPVDPAPATTGPPAARGPAAAAPPAAPAQREQARTRAAPRTPAERLRERVAEVPGRVLAGAGLALLVLVIALTAALGGSDSPQLEVTDSRYVRGARNAVLVTGTIEPRDAAVRVAGKRARVRGGRWRAVAPAGARGTVAVTAQTGEGERTIERVTVPGPRLAGSWIVVQSDISANAVIGGRVSRGRAEWRFRPVCREGRCSGAVLTFPSPGGDTDIRLRRAGKVFTGVRRYTLQRSGICLGTARASRWTTQVRLTVTAWRRGRSAPTGTRFRGVARHRSRFEASLPCEGGRLVTRVSGRRA